MSDLLKKDKGVKDVKDIVEVPDQKPNEESLPKITEVNWFRGHEKSPSNWHITADGDRIKAVCSGTGRVFEGTMEEFNQKLRG